MTPADHDLHTLAGAFVLDAVSDDERSAFAAHLADCGACREEIRELRAAAAQLGSSEYARPRPELRSETVRAAARISQLAPAPEQAPIKASRPGRRTSPGWRRPGTLTLARKTIARRLALGAAAVILAGAAVIGVVMHDTMRTLHHSQRQNRLITAVLSAPDAVMRTAPVSVGGMARVVMSDREHMGVLTARGLPPLPAAEHYQLWLMGPLGDRSIGRLRIGHGGMAGPAVIQGMAAGDMIALTVEPAGHSTRPSSAPVVLIGP